MRLPVGDLPEADWHRCLDVNLTGVYLSAKAAIPAMRENGGGSIITCPLSMGLSVRTYGQRMSLPKAV